MSNTLNQLLAQNNAGFRFGLASVPIIMFMLFLCVFAAFSQFLHISEPLGQVGFSNVGKSLNIVKESMYRNFWGVSLIVLSVANFVLIALTLSLLRIVKSPFKISSFISLGLASAGLVLWLLIFCKDLSGGIVEKVYEAISVVFTELDREKIVHFETIIDAIVANGYLGVYLAAVLLAKLCLVVQTANNQIIHDCLKFYNFLFLTTAMFLSLSILQMFLQYQWFNVFLLADAKINESLNVLTFGTPLMMSLFYVAMFITIFFPAEVVLKNIALAKGAFEDENLPKNAEIKVVGYARLKSFLVFFSPFLTALLAESVKTKFG